MSRRTVGRGLVGVGIAVLLWAALAFTNDSLGGPPDELIFANRRPYNEVKRAAHDAFLPLLLRTVAGMGLLLVGGRLLRKENDQTQD